MVGLGLGLYPCPLGSPDLCLCDSSLPWWGLRLRAEKRERVVRVNVYYGCVLSLVRLPCGAGGSPASLIETQKFLLSRGL